MVIFAISWFISIIVALLTPEYDFIFKYSDKFGNENDEWKEDI